ncbi:MAG: cation:proton antiporter [Treponema sp.]|jgi:Kef-type K+ transport system membrane component KefB/mannitol/fructose-specific phosphotransferase system IIA component (Ntr-type)|nr:cation:proton antiporter [Treponema sp.]
METTELMASLVLQLGVIIFAVRLGGRLVKKLGVPQVLGELLAGVLIGPYALGAIPLPGFPQGLFSSGPLPPGETLAVSPELYAFAMVASIVLLFASGLETDLGLFLRYSVAGGLIGIGGVLASFALGNLAGAVLLRTAFTDPRCRFLGILSTATSVGITARILSDHKKMDTPEGVTTLAAAVFDDVLGIVALAVVLGVVTVLNNSEGAGFSPLVILAIAGKAFGIWLGFTLLGLVFSKHLAVFLKTFKHSYDFSILALGIALVLAGVFEKQGLAMIIGAYITGLSLSKTDIAPIIQERIHGLYEFFVPVFFAVMGMMVNVREIFSPPVLIFGGVYTLAAIVSKVIGCGVPALFLGFNLKGALRIGTGMIPRGEVALIIAGIGLASDILDTKLFAVVILMTLFTTFVAPPFLSFTLKMPGSGARNPVKTGDSVSASWDFQNDEIADLVIDILLKDLRGEGFFVQMMNINEGISQARKDDISLSITEAENSVTIITGEADMPFVKTAVYEVILRLSDAIGKLKDSADPASLRKDLMDGRGRTAQELLSIISGECIATELRGGTKDEVLTELVDILAYHGRLSDRDRVLKDIFEREKTMSTGMQHGIALPHAKSEGVKDICAAVGIKKDGVSFDSIDGEPSRLFIMVASPKRTSSPHIQFLAAIGSVLKDDAVRERVINACSQDEVLSLLRRT